MRTRRIITRRLLQLWQRPGQSTTLPRVGSEDALDLIELCVQPRHGAPYAQTARSFAMRERISEIASEAGFAAGPESMLSA